MTARERDDGASWVTLLASVGLFLTTTAVAQFAQALASQWNKPVRQRGRRKRGDFQADIVNNQEEEEEDLSMEKLRRWYHSRRVHDRLSYENLQDAWPTHPGSTITLPPYQPNSSQMVSSLTLDENDLTLRRGNMYSLNHKQDMSNLYGLIQPSSQPFSQLSEWDMHHQATNQRQQSFPSFQSLERRDSLTNATNETMHPNADYDFHPKNRNWRHFEHFNEKDQRRPIISITPTNPSQDASQNEENCKMNTTNMANTHSVATTTRTRMMDTDDEEDEEQQDANSLSSEGSDSSEEQFVWMKHLHRHRTSALSQPEEQPQYQQQSRMTAFLNLFKDDSAPTSKPSSSKAIDVPLATRMQEPDSSKQSNGDLSRNHENQKILQPSPSLPLPTTTHIAPHRQMKRESSIPIMAMGSHSHRQLRAQYNATIMPKKLILIRHGQSMGNINELLYSTTPDNAMPLTQLGWEQARAAGNILKNKVLTSGERVHFIVSPYVRTVETFHGMVSAWVDPKEFSHIVSKEKRIKAWYRRLMELGLTWNEDSRIREQDFGNYQDPETIRKAKQERHRFGIFYYRFPHGESASDVFDRVSTFLDSLWRSFEMNKSQNYVLVTHGISIRVLLARYFRYTIDQFNILANPRNCEMVVLGHNGQGRLDLQGRVSLELGTTTEEEDGDPEKEKEGGVKDRATKVHVKGYKFHKRLRILPKHAIRKVKIRISPDD